MKILILVALAVTLSFFAHAQTCTPAGDETSYGGSNTWIGYIYDNPDFTHYSGTVNEGNAASPNFNESFGGDYVNYATNGCDVYTETFSARYKLTKTFAAGQYQITVGGDDGFRLSLDGGNTWIINRWTDQSYTYTTYAATLSGTYNLVLEYYESGGNNRLFFSVDAVCLGTEDQSVYGTGDTWKGYLYTGMNFNNYSGLVTEGVPGNPSFDENFGGDNTFYNTSACGINTEQFSARYLLQKTFTNGEYLFTVGGDDGYRLSLDGGNTWPISNWGDHGYTSSTYSAVLNGSYQLVLEYYENGGGNRLSVDISQTLSLLPVTLLSFNGKAAGSVVNLNWTVSSEINTDYYLVERSSNGNGFTMQGKVPASGTGNSIKNYSFTDALPLTGISYYRLRIVDKDGKTAYSPVIKITATEKPAVSVYPSVLHREPVYFSSSTGISNGILDLFDMNGKKLQSVRLPATVTPGQTIPLALTIHSAGVYAAIIRSGQEIIAKQILIAR